MWQLNMVFSVGTATQLVLGENINKYIIFI